MPGAGYIFAGGGTGGHLFPGMAVAEELRRQLPDVAVEFWGTERELERRILAENGWTHRSMTGEPSTNFRRHPLRVLRGHWCAFRQARQWLAAQPPAAVIGLGGFSSAPVVYAAHRLRIPILLLEQNIIPGRATKYLSRWSDVVCTSFPQTETFLSNRCHIEVTGNPISRELTDHARSHHAADFTSPQERPRLLILGGSQGASAINQALIDALPRLFPHLQSWHIVHQTGAADVEQVRSAYAERHIEATVAAFLSPMSPWYAHTECVVSRAGATTLAELACCGIPAILIPYPHAVNQHQLKNAEYYRERLAAVIVEQQGSQPVFAEKLTDQLVGMLTDTQRRKQMSEAMQNLAIPDAATTVAGLIAKLTPSRT